LFAGVFLVGQAGTWLSVANPMYALEPALRDLPDSTQLVQRLLGAITFWGAIAATCLALAVWQCRPASLKLLESAGRQPRWQPRSRRRPRVGDQAVRWKEHHVDGLTTLRILRHLPGWLCLSLTVLTALIISSLLLGARLPWHYHRNEAAALDFLRQGTALCLLFSLVVAIRCAYAIRREREQKTWDALLLTGLDAEALLRGKLLGIIDAAGVYLLAYGIPASALASLHSWAALFWTILMLAMTWQVMYFFGAVCLEWSTRESTALGRMLSWLAGGNSDVGFLLMMAPFFTVQVLAAGIVSLGPDAKSMDDVSFTWETMLVVMVLAAILSFCLNRLAVSYLERGGQRLEDAASLPD
jgi:hypothetical protein